MKHPTYLALLSAVVLLFPFAAFARAKNEHSVNIPDTVKIGSQQLKPGNYKVEWQGTAPSVQVKFLQDGKTVATAPAKLQANNSQQGENDIVTYTTKSNTKALSEIDFARPNEALVFTHSGL